MEMFSAACSNGPCMPPVWLVAMDFRSMRARREQAASIAGQDWRRDRDPARYSRAVKQYLASLDDKAWGAASDVVGVGAPTHLFCTLLQSMLGVQTGRVAGHLR